MKRPLMTETTPDLVPRWCFGVSQASTSVKIKLYLLLRQSGSCLEDVIP
jgi:hypothetical protein